MDPNENLQLYSMIAQDFKSILLYSYMPFNLTHRGSQRKTHTTCFKDIFHV